MVVSSASKAILLPFPSPSQLRLWFLVSHEVMEASSRGTTWLLILTPELYAASFIGSRLAQPGLAMDESVFLWVSLIHRLARSVAHFSYGLKVVVTWVCRTWELWRHEGFKAVRRQWWRQRTAMFSEVLSFLMLEILLCLGASFKLLLAHLIRHLPFGGAHLIALYWTSSMLMATVYAVIDLGYLVAGIFAPLGWRTHREFPSAGARPPSLDAVRELSQIEHRANVLERTFALFVDERGRPLRNAHHGVVEDAPPEEPKWPPMLPSRGPPVTETEDATLSREYPDAMCPISHCLLLDPVVARSGATYNRSSIEAHLRHTGTDPVTNDPCDVTDLRPNYALRNLIDDIIDRSRRARTVETQTLLPCKRPLVVSLDDTDSDDDSHKRVRVSPSESWTTVADIDMIPTDVIRTPRGQESIDDDDDQAPEKKKRRES